MCVYVYVHVYVYVYVYVCVYLSAYMCVCVRVNHTLSSPPRRVPPSRPPPPPPIFVTESDTSRLSGPISSRLSTSRVYLLDERSEGYT